MTRMTSAEDKVLGQFEHTVEGADAFPVHKGQEPTAQLGGTARVWTGANSAGSLFLYRVEGFGDALNYHWICSLRALRSEGRH